MYRCALGSAGEVVDAATDLLAAGEDSMLLAQLAGISKGQADMEVGQALPGAMESVSAPLFDAESTECQLVAVDGLAERYRNGVIDGRELVRRVHVRFGHVSPALIEALSVLDDSYDLLPVTGGSEAKVDHNVDDALTALTAAVDEIIRSYAG
jgi:hypothetical protein